ncbi:ABC transporter permease subunit [Streptacidiphilus sp. 4-A2]|nr:ABC transporter permease subunit [Streptacidiphilus sp. 4-A2]
MSIDLLTDENSLRTGEVPPTRLGNVLASEWTKIRSVQSTLWTLASMFALILGLALIADGYSYNRAEGGGYLGNGVGGFIVGQIPVVTLGVLVITSEYGTGMIRTTLTAYPRRVSLLTAKAMVFFALAFVLGTLATALQLCCGMVILGGQEDSPTLGQILLAVFGGGLYLALMGLFALSVGTLLRHSAGAISVMLGVLLLPFILALFLPTGMRELLLTYSPINMSASLYGSGTGDVGGWALLGVLASATAVILATACLAMRRRDV